MAANTTLSLSPETFVEGGGMLNDDNVEILDASFIVFNYKGGATATCLSLNLQASGHDEPVETVFSVGSPDDFLPSEDGKSVVITHNSSKTAMSATCNLAYFIKSLCDAGFDPAKLGDDFCDNLKGMKLHLKRKNFGKQGQSDKDRTALIVESILSDGDSNAGGNAPANTGGNAGGGGNNPDIDAAVEVVTGLIAENDGTIAKSKIVPLAFAAAKKQYPGNQNLMKIIANPGFLPEHFTIDGSNVTFK